MTALRGAVLALCAAAACGGGTPSPADERAVVDDYARQHACVTLATTRAEADACTKRVTADRPVDVYRRDGGTP